MKYILKWNTEIDSGYVLNKIYPKGYVFEGLVQKPILHIEYQDVVYDEALEIYTITINDVVRSLTEEEKGFVKGKAVKYTDTRYVHQDEIWTQKITELITALTDGFDYHVKCLAGFTPAHEMDSWITQQTEAEAYIADNTAVTPLIDSILETRGDKYTKTEFCYKVVEKSIYYKVNYGKLLGEYNKNLDEIQALSTEEEYLTYIGVTNESTNY